MAAKCDRHGGEEDPDQASRDQAYDTLYRTDEVCHTAPSEEAPGGDHVRETGVVGAERPLLAFARQQRKAPEKALLADQLVTGMSRWLLHGGFRRRSIRLEGRE